MRFLGFEPVFRQDARVLILGTMPSPKSIEQGFYYGHPKNRFWPVLSTLLGCAVPAAIYEKKAMLLENGLALWDVLSSCDRESAADATIKNEIPNDLCMVARACPHLRAAALNGAAAYRLYKRHFPSDLFPEALNLPSTSPANAACGIEELLSHWSGILKFL